MYSPRCPPRGLWGPESGVSGYPGRWGLQIGVPGVPRTCFLHSYWVINLSAPAAHLGVYGVQKGVFQAIQGDGDCRLGFLGFPEPVSYIQIGSPTRQCTPSQTWGQLGSSSVGIASTSMKFCTGVVLREEKIFVWVKTLYPNPGVRGPQMGFRVAVPPEPHVLNHAFS